MNDNETATVSVGSPAPDFSLKHTPSGELLSLDSLRGQPVVLAFYPADWSGVCGEQLSLYNEILPEIEALGAKLFGISVDSNHSHVAYAESKNLGFPLLADFHPKGEVSKAYDSWNEELGRSDRNLFVIDGEGIIRWMHRSPSGVNPGANGFLTALEALSKGEEPRS